MFFEIIRRKFPHVESSLIAGNSLFYLFSKKQERGKGKAVYSLPAVDTSFVQQEFFQNGKLKIEQLPKGKSESAYYLVTSKGKLSPKIPLHLVVAIERNGSFLMNGEYPFLYLAYDQSRLVDLKKDEQEFYVAFQLPKEALPSDDLIMYFWNPEKGNVKTSDLNIYLIDDLVTN
jgi:hypothetical protein